MTQYRIKLKEAHYTEKLHTRTLLEDLGSDVLEMHLSWGGLALGWCFARRVSTEPFGPGFMAVYYPVRFFEPAD